MGEMEIENTTCILRQAIGFSISTDGGSKRLGKTYPICVHVFDPVSERVVWKTLCVLQLEKTDRANAETLFTYISEAFNKSKLDWRTCLALGADNTAVMSGNN